MKKKIKPFFIYNDNEDFIKRIEETKKEQRQMQLIFGAMALFLGVLMFIGLMVIIISNENMKEICHEASGEFTSEQTCLINGEIYQFVNVNPNGFGKYKLGRIAVGVK